MLMLIKSHGEKLLIRSTLASGSIRAVVLEPPNTWDSSSPCFSHDSLVH
jgi:hypothetical protein